MSPRPYAARLAATELLKKLWRQEQSVSPGELLQISIPEAIRTFGLCLELVPSVLDDKFLAGRLLRSKRLIQLATHFPVPSRRFTAAHELGHFLLHTAQEQFCDREPLTGAGTRPYFETEADIFAAEFLMPRKYLEEQFFVRFGLPIDGTVSNRLVTDALSAGKSPDGVWTPETFVAVDPLSRAREIAALANFGRSFFSPLIEVFGVSKKAMGIRLLNLGLVA
jgi:hypothetical protein